MSNPSQDVRISGGAGPHETAAIMAVVSHIATEEAAAAATPPQRPRQSAWVLAWRPRPATIPLPSDTYDAMPWAEVEPATEINP
jgi:hypothetical protein